MIGASLSEPHIDEFAVNVLYIYIYIYICRMSCHKSLPALILRVLASCVISKMTRAACGVHAVKARRTVTRMNGQCDRGNLMLDLRLLC